MWQHKNPKRNCFLKPPLQYSEYRTSPAMLNMSGAHWQQRQVVNKTVDTAGYRSSVWAAESATSLYHRAPVVGTPEGGRLSRCWKFKYRVVSYSLIIQHATICGSDEKCDKRRVSQSGSRQHSGCVCESVLKSLSLSKRQLAHKSSQLQLLCFGEIERFRAKINWNYI
jgi:hypothetical protein